MALHILGVFYFVLCWVSLAEYNWVLRVLSHPVAGEVLYLLKVETKCRWAWLLCICFSSMLLLEGVIWASNMIQTNDLVIISKSYCLTYCIWNWTCINYLWPYYKVISAANSVYVICICLIKYDLSCEVDLLRPFVVLNALLDLYKRRYARINMFNRDSHT
jgi:hypothetical protein